AVVHEVEPATAMRTSIRSSDVGGARRRARHPGRNVIAPCLLCGGGEYRRVLSRDAVDIIRCWKCGLTRVDPLPSRDDVLANYRERFFEGNGSYLPYDADEALRKRSFRRLLTAIERYRQGGRARQSTRLNSSHQIS